MCLRFFFEFAPCIFPCIGVSSEKFSPYDFLHITVTLSVGRQFFSNLRPPKNWQSGKRLRGKRNAADMPRSAGTLIWELIFLKLLAPEIVHAILAGTLQKSIPINMLSKTMPERWADQKKLFGFE